MPKQSELTAGAIKIMPTLCETEDYKYGVPFTDSTYWTPIGGKDLQMLLADCTPLIQKWDALKTRTDRGDAIAYRLEWLVSFYACNGPCNGSFIKRRRYEGIKAQHDELAALINSTEERERSNG